jgi:hypothetical protein
MAKRTQSGSAGEKDAADTDTPKSSARSETLTSLMVSSR